MDRAVGEAAIVRVAEPCDEAADLKAREYLWGHRRATKGWEQVVPQKQLLVLPGPWPQGAGRRVQLERFLGDGGKGRRLGRGQRTQS